MSITIHQSPTGYTSAHGEVWHVVESTNKAVTGFQYVFDIYKSGSLITRVKNTPYGTDKLGVLDVSNIVRSFVAIDNAPASMEFDSFTPLTTLDTFVNWSEYDVRYGEVSGGVLSENILSGTYKVYNNYKRPKWDNAQSEITGPMIISNRPTDSYWYDGEPVVISTIQISGQSYIRKEKEGSTTLQSKSYPQTNLETCTIVSWIPTADNVTFELSGSVSGIIGTRNIKKKCAKYKKHTIMFLNAFGGFDSFTFIHGKLLNDNEKKKFEQSKWKLFNNSMNDTANRLDEYTSIIFNESSKVYAGKINNKMQLTSDILSTSEYDWLVELINSPLVYYMDTINEKLYPVIITDTNYEYKDDRINKTDTLTVNIEFSDSTNIQYR